LEDAETAVIAGRPPGAPAPGVWLLSGRAPRSYLDARFALGDVLVFGKESDGLPESILESRQQSLLGIPVLGGVRSHNLANAVAIVLYEALRQTGLLDGATLS